MSYLFTSESVSSGHPDKIADIISDAILDNFLAFDPLSRVACETMVTTGQVIVSGEVKSSTYLDVQEIVRKTINDIGYIKGEYQFSGDSCGVISIIHEQSSDIDSGITKNKIEDIGAGDQGIMFGYATDETENFIPISLDISHRIMEFLTAERFSKKNISYLRPDAKAQVTVKYSDKNIVEGIDSVLVSTQHDPEIDLRVLRDDLTELLLEYLNNQYSLSNKKLFDNTNFLINPAGKFVIGGPHGDTGLTGRKIIVDTYGGKGSHGGGAFSGKDSTKVDRSAAYMARYISKNIVAAGVCSKIQIQLAYAIGISQPVSINVNTFGTSKIDLDDSQVAELIMRNFELTPFSIQKTLKLTDPIFKETASFGHFGRKVSSKIKTFKNPFYGSKEKKVELFPWEKLDLIDKIKSLFKING